MCIYNTKHFYLQILQIIYKKKIKIKKLKFGSAIFFIYKLWL